ncbi:MAG: hypothetical protein MJ246_01950 [Clostridia bacterium]|nr:hypothetical protein [Clostridia bacterium]
MRNEIASIKAGKVITSLSLIATLALVFTMALSSYLIFASESDEIVINDITYTTFTKTGADGKYHSFINLGKYPRTKETNSTIISALGSLSPDSKTGIITHPTYGEYVKYSTNYYKVEPIR